MVLLFSVNVMADGVTNILYEDIRPLTVRQIMRQLLTYERENLKDPRGVRVISCTEPRRGDNFGAPWQTWMWWESSCRVRARNGSGRFVEFDANLQLDENHIDTVMQDDVGSRWSTN